MIPSSVTRGLRAIRQFDGRDSPQEFWPYAAAAVAAALVPAFAASVFVMVFSFLIGGDSVTSVLLPAMLTITVLMAAAVVVLLAAAVSRRLHDRGLSGWWGVPPLALLIAGMGLMTPTFLSADESPEPDLFVTTFAVVILYFVALGLLVLQLALPGKPAITSLRDP